MPRRKQEEETVANGYVNYISTPVFTLLVVIIEF